MIDAIDPYAVALAVTSVLDGLGVSHTIGGSIASSFAGEPRSTIDIDVVADIEEQHVEPFVATLARAFYVDADALRRAIRHRSSANLIPQSQSASVPSSRQSSARRPNQR